METVSAADRRQGLGSRAAAWLPWMLGDAFILFFLVRDLWLTHGLVIDRLDVWGRDFVNVWTGGQLIRQGSFSTLADVSAYQAFQHRLFGQLGQHNYSYPPVTYPIAALLSHLPYLLALAVWQIAGAAFFVWSAKPWWPRRAGPVWLVVVTPAALLNIWAGHYGFFIGGLFLLGWRQVELGRSTVAGLCFGLMIIKPHLAVLVPVALASRRDWKVIASATICALGLVTITAVMYGIRPWYDFLFGTSRVQASLIDSHGSFFGLMSTSSMTAVLSLSGSWILALLIQLLFSASALWTVVVSGLRSTDVRSHALLTATATFLFLPYAFNYDMTVVAIGAITIMISANASMTERRLAFYGFVGPQFGMILAAFGLPIMAVFNSGLLAAQFRQSRRSSQVPALSARTVSPLSLTSAKPPVTGMRSGLAPWLR